LTLYAEGSVPNFTSGITFNCVHWIGGLKFSPDGWTGPRGEGSRPYVHGQSFKLDLPSLALPSGNVIIVTANHPRGKIPQLLADLNSQPLPPGNIEQLILSDQSHITALFKLPFTIQASDEVPQLGKVDIIFDPQFLVMTTAGIQGRDIVWTFNSLQTGNTQIIVATTGGISPFTTRKTYDVRIVVLEPIESGPQGGAILNFLGRATIADRIVKEKYPDAELNVIDASLPVGTSATTNPINLLQLRATFCTAVNGTVIIKSTGWGSWGPLEFIDQPFLGNGMILWPVKMDIAVAGQLMEAAGYTGNFMKCTLRHPRGRSGKPAVQPYYIFEMEEGPAVFVGVDDSSV
ncbi:hypothetical protein K440DRAFT_568136, partial [Wilcoxina mikolae CBS 423.85]